ncbi:hypothetical protein [Deefgea sp. CFH1-16]|uniref:hypothetical protein n=1 Tax=Deefgea sp. CFH1-16 TaxID=2675457 RepID=UPI00194024DB|nr:hypothetical protein [Deefgea sp. CFH1-16]
MKLSNIIFLFLLIVLVDMYLMLVLYSIITYKTDGQNHSLSAKEVTDRVLEKKFGRINSKNLTQRIMILVFAMLFFDHFVLNKFGWF